MRALQVLADEHQSLAAILHAVRFMLKEIGAGRLKPDIKLLRGMVDYLEAYPEQQHHPKEDRLLFGRLAARTDEGRELLDKLFRQHAGTAERIALLEKALDAFAQNPADVAGLSAAFDTYAEFYRNHMILEEREILPLLRKHFTADDWAEIDAELAATGNTMGGAPGEDFAAIFSKLVASAPPPIGFGAGPYEG
ncbi:hemerythrin domain-containing protein [Zoogloea sp.]|uniref:hemerythrin domain-containing protein n=1 Tax=Zoogloea sp. TaxID=49181 RepID=UPI001AD05234|nr:hemerythrin domain-containing protein [Zoogloea sp.]MBN8285636.1 hemerythrin domain-containing protein [Zoogloea sp.]